MNVADLVTRQAQRQPQAPALARKAARFTYAQLDAAIAHVAERIGAAGAAPGDLVGVAMRTSPMHLIVLLALGRLGVVSIPVPPGELAARRRELVARYRLATIVSDFKHFGVEGCALLLVDPGWLRPRRAAAPRPAGGAYDPLWRIMVSSGTTGTPKGIPMSHARMLARTLLYGTLTQCGPGFSYLCFRDLDAMDGLLPCLVQLATGGSVVFAPTTEIPGFFEAVAQFRPTHARASPGLLRSLLDAAPAAAPACPSLVRFELGGAALPLAAAEEAAKRITPHVISTYGATEAARLAVADLELLRKGASGRLVPWVEAQVVDEGGAALAPGASGILRYRGLAFADGYYQDPAASAAAFRDGWFHPGDLGRIEAGLVTVEGRADDVVNLGGAKVAPLQVEQVLERHPAVAEAAAFGKRGADGEQRLYAAVVARAPVEERALLEHCREHLGRMAPSRVFLLKQLPRTASGKVLRRELAQRVGTRRK